MSYFYHELFSSRLKDSLLPLEFKRQKALFEHLTNLATEQDIKCRQLMSQILAKKQANEDFEESYECLLLARKWRDIYAAEAA